VLLASVVSFLSCCFSAPTPCVSKILERLLAFGPINLLGDDGEGATTVAFHRSTATPPFLFLLCSSAIQRETFGAEREGLRLRPVVTAGGAAAHRSAAGSKSAILLIILEADAVVFMRLLEDHRELAAGDASLPSAVAVGLVSVMPSKVGAEDCFCFRFIMRPGGGDGAGLLVTLIQVGIIVFLLVLDSLV
jgi:hypothetical protein